MFLTETKSKIKTEDRKTVMLIGNTFANTATIELKICKTVF